MLFKTDIQSATFQFIKISVLISVIEMAIENKL